MRTVVRPWGLIRGISAATIGFSLIFLINCNSHTEAGSENAQIPSHPYVSRAELRKQLEQAQEQIKELSAHKYSTLESGSRTWRFDAVTGETCILLAPEWDWKRKETRRQS